MKYYCIGIKGTGMSTLAQILHDLGNEVSGYDDAEAYKFTQKGLEERNIPIYYDQNHDIDKDTIVTYSVAFSEDHKELVRVRNLGLKVVKYNEIIGSVMNLFKSIGVSGTHGKTTTSSLIRHILESNGGCNYFIGAGDGYASSENAYFVVESDEFNKHFTAYHPMYSIITNIEKEHMECYKDLDDIRNTFEIFANQTGKLVVANGDNQEIKKINYNTRVLFYGFGFNNDVIIKNLKLTEEGINILSLSYIDSLLTQLILSKTDIGTQSGVDTYFLEKASNDKKTILEVESYEFQSNLEKSFPDRVNEISITDAIDHMDEAITDLNNLYKYWKDGNVEELEKLLVEIDESDYSKEDLALMKDYNKKMLDDRNIGMKNKLEEYFNNNYNVFYMVGTAHLIGDNGIAKLVENDGYIVKRVQ